MGLDYVRAIGCYEMGAVDIKVDSYLYTGRMTEKVGDWDERFYGVAFAEGTQTGRETYTAPNGMEAQIMAAERTGGHDTCLAAFFAIFPLTTAENVVEYLHADILCDFKFLSQRRFAPVIKIAL